MMPQYFALNGENNTNTIWKHMKLNYYCLGSSRPEAGNFDRLLLLTHMDNDLLDGILIWLRVIVIDVRGLFSGMYANANRTISVMKRSR